MGGYYARHDGEPEDVAGAIAAQYRTGAGDDGDAAPLNRSATALLIADRVETLVGIWGIGLKPTGEKDPYALRRHALTLIAAFPRTAQRDRRSARRCATSRGRRLDVRRCRSARNRRGGRDFVYERYANQLPALRPARGRCGDRPAAAAARGRRPRPGRARFPGAGRAAALAAANKRVGNILKKIERAAPASSMRRCCRSLPSARCTVRSASVDAARRGAPSTTASTPLAQAARRPEAAGRCVLRQGHGQRREPALRANRLRCWPRCARR